MLSDFEIIQKLWDLGHFFSPEALKVELVKEEDLSKLSLDDKVVNAAVRSAQSFMSFTLDHITAKLGQPITSHVGDVDEATRLLFEVPRCGHPDFMPPSEALKLVGVGSWPEPCQKAGVKYHLDRSKMPGELQGTIDSIIADVVRAYGSVGLKLIPVATAAEANIQAYWTPLAGSTIGIAQFNNGSCKNQVYSKLDTGYAGYMRSLILHEWGHCCNLQHTRGGIMNPSITPDPSPFGWHKDDPSYPVLVRFFGGEPIDDPTPPPIPPIPPGPSPGGITLKLPIKMIDADGKKFNLVAWPEV